MKYYYQTIWNRIVDVKWFYLCIGYILYRKKDINFYLVKKMFGLS
jgi:hypothetical protein